MTHSRRVDNIGLQGSRHVSASVLVLTVSEISLLLGHSTGTTPLNFTRMGTFALEQGRVPFFLG